MALTAAEVTYANNLLARGKSTWRNWAVVRWLVMFVGLMVVVVGANMVGAALTPSEEAVRAARMAARTQPAKTGEARDAELAARIGQVETRINEASTRGLAETMRMSLLMSFGAVLLVGGIGIVGYALHNWNAHLRDALLSKAIREAFEHELAGTTGVSKSTTTIATAPTGGAPSTGTPSASS